MQMLNFPTEKSPMKVKFNECLVIEKFKTCLSIWQMEAKKQIQGEPIFTSVHPTNTHDTEKRGMSYSSQVSQHAISNSLQKFSNVFFDLQLQVTEIKYLKHHQRLPSWKEQAARDSSMYCFSDTSQLFPDPSTDHKLTKTIQTCLSRSYFSYVVKSFHSWFQSSMQHYGAGLTCSYSHCFTRTTTLMPANIMVTCVTCCCIIPQHNAQHTQKIFLNCLHALFSNLFHPFVKINALHLMTATILESKIN